MKRNDRKYLNKISNSLGRAITPYATNKVLEILLDRSASSHDRHESWKNTREGIKRPDGMGIAEFIETYIVPDIKIHLAQKKIIEAIKRGDKFTIQRSQPYDKSLFYRELAKAFKEGKIKLYGKSAKQIVLVDEADFTPKEVLEAKRKEHADENYSKRHYMVNWPAEAFGVDAAKGKDGSVTVFVKKEEAE